MSDYQVARQLKNDSGITITLLDVNDNVKSINRSIIPRPQLDEVMRYRQMSDVNKRLLSRSYLYEYIRDNYGATRFDLKQNQYGKLYLADAPGVHFNFSYANGLVAVGISNKTNFGVDIEYVDPKLNPNEIVSHIMHTNELSKFRLIGDRAGQLTYLIDVFCAKESIIKAFGTGLSFDVLKLDTSDNDRFVYREKEYQLTQPDSFMNDVKMSLCYELITDR